MNRHEDTIPKVNPYLPTSLANHAWASCAEVFESQGRARALQRAASYDRDMNLGLETQVMRWEH